MISCHTIFGTLLALATSAAGAADFTPIHSVQGRAHRSPLEGRMVSVTGIVTGVGRTEFTLQSAPGAEDDDPATSEALLVVMAGAAALRPGDSISVSGRVEEERPGGRSSNLTVTRLVAEDGAKLLGHDQPLPAPILLGRTGRQPPMGHIDDDSQGSVESRPLHFDPDADAIDFFESLESMLVSVPQPRAVSPTSKYGEVVVICDDGLDNPSLSPDGMLVLADGDTNPERLIVDDTWEDVPEVSAGARFDGPMVGVMAYEWGTYRLWLTEPCPSAHGGRKRDVAPPAPPGGLRIVSFNVENLSPRSDPARVAALAEQIVDALGSPDLIALQEIQDGSGPDDDGVVSGAATYAVLQAAIDAAGGPTYEALEIAPINGADGGQPGGNIRVAFLVRSDSALEIVERPAGSATEAAKVLRDAGGAARLSCNPGRVSPGDPAWKRSRVSLVVELRWKGRTLFVINNHWSSKGGDDSLFGPVQPPVRHSEERRVPQAALVHDFVTELLGHDEQALVVVLGDFNDFGFSAAMQRLQRDGALTDLLLGLPALERWTYVYQGNAQALDHLLVSPGISAGGAALDFRAVHLNAAFPGQASDHDPLVLTLRWPGDG
jgi:predicted extracellular nuclease